MSLRVIRAFGLATVQDLGRPGHMHEALAPGGALAPDLLVAANRRVRNSDDAAAIEICGELVVRADADVVVATERGARQMRAGDELRIASEPRRTTYLALRGGVSAPRILGGRGTMLSAGIGELLRAGATLSAADAPARADALDLEPPYEHDPSHVHAIRVIAGPDLDAFAPDALDLLTAAPYRISTTSNRVGTRLEGPPLPRLPRENESAPMVRGAIEVPPDGQPIVLGPEHPTTGGYPVLAVVAHADLSHFFSVHLGGSIRFVSQRHAP